MLELSLVFLQVINFALDSIIVELEFLHIGAQLFIVLPDTNHILLQAHSLIEKLLVVSQQRVELIFEFVNLNSSLIELPNEGILITFQIVDFEVLLTKISPESINFILELAGGSEG